MYNLLIFDLLLFISADITITLFNQEDDYEV